MTSVDLAYLDPDAVDLLPGRDRILGIIGYGVDRPPHPAPFAAAGFPVIEGGGVCEIWSGSSPARYWQHGPVAGAVSTDAAFGLVELEQGGRRLEDVAAEAYRCIFDFLDTAGFEVPIRFWNYIPRINAEEAGLERYRRFNIGRHDVFRERLRQAVPPAASALGTRGGPVLVYFLAARDVAVPIENSRQVSAYAYPPLYGPRSPGFSRASLHGSGAGARLLISGTATAHRTR